jgi:hypothetical protein
VIGPAIGPSLTAFACADYRPVVMHMTGISSPA